MDIFQQMTCMTTTVEAHDRKWIVIERLTASKTGTYALVVEEGEPLPATPKIISIPKREEKLDNNSK